MKIPPMELCCYMRKDVQTDGWRNRQTDRQTGRQADIQAGMQT